MHELALRTYARSILHAFAKERGETEAAALSSIQLIEPLSPLSQARRQQPCRSQRNGTSTTPSPNELSPKRVVPFNCTHLLRVDPFELRPFSDFRVVSDGVASTAANPKLYVKVSLHLWMLVFLCIRISAPLGVANTHLRFSTRCCLSNNLGLAHFK